MKNKPATNPSHHPQLNRLRRIEGQIRGLQKMIIDEKYCVSILQQFKSVHAALNRVELEIMKTHIENCIMEALQKKSKPEITKKLSEIMHLIETTR